MEENLILQQSEDAEIRYYEGGAVAVDNYDTDVKTEKQKYQATVQIDTDGNILCTPFGIGSRRGPRSVTICDTGVAKLTKSPMGSNVRMVILLPRECASEKNFRQHLNNLFDQVRENGINLMEEA